MVYKGISVSKYNDYEITFVVENNSQQQIRLDMDSDSVVTNGETTIPSSFFSKEVLTQAFRKGHDGHRTFKALIKAGHGVISYITVLGDDLISLFPGFLQGPAVEHLLKLGAETRLVFLRRFV